MALVFNGRHFSDELIVMQNSEGVNRFYYDPRVSFDAELRRIDRLYPGIHRWITIPGSMTSVGLFLSGAAALGIRAFAAPSAETDQLVDLVHSTTLVVGSLSSAAFCGDWLGRIWRSELLTLPLRKRPRVHLNH
jgi:hypothetical protein